MFKHLSILAYIVFIFSGCGAYIDSIEAFIPVPLEKSEFMPSKDEIKNTKTKVVLTPIDNGNFTLAKKANLGQSLYVELERELSASGTVEILDRDIAKKFDNEIKLSEIGGESQMNEVELSIAKFAISGSISNVQFTSTFTQVQYWTDKEGKSHVIPAHYTYAASVSGILKIYSIPSMKILKTIEFYDRTSRREDSKYYGENRYPADVSGMINEAGSGAIHSTRNEFKNYLAPKGYVMAKRVKDDMTIVEVSIGSSDGLETGEDVQLYADVSVINPLTDEEEIQKRKIADGIISDKITEHRAWIIIKDNSAEIKLGDYIKASYGNGFFDYLNNAGKKYHGLMR